ncbi:MAG: RNA-binding cell elongation regulator Jag/EloR [Candidatus Aquicultor sp.]
MTTVVEKEGGTVEEAIKEALEELGVDRADAKVEILEEESKGFFGRLGAGKARVRVSVIDRGVQKTEALIKEIMEYLGVDGDIAVHETDDAIKIDITGGELGLLIGKRGETLSAIQTIANVTLRKAGTVKKLLVDIENYRQRRAESLEEMAKQAAEKVASTGRTVVLKPMNAYDRRMIHLALQDNDKVFTESQGEEPDRLVKIVPKA